MDGGFRGAVRVFALGRSTPAMGGRQFVNISEATSPAADVRRVLCMLVAVAVFGQGNFSVHELRHRHDCQKWQARSYTSSVRRLVAKTRDNP